MNLCSSIFGGKSRVARVVWERIGDVDSYVEPFFGSGAVLFGRPHSGPRRETVNDFDGYVANFWRAVQADPDAVARWADWPCNENDLTARHIWLVRNGANLRDQLEGNPDFFDAKIAGWWCWGQCWWIGGGWCSGKGAWTSDGERIVRGSGGVSRRRPSLRNSRGVKRQLPHLGGDGQGVNRQLESGSTCEDYSEHVRGLVRRVSDRLRRVRVCCGDWSRVVTPSAAGYVPSDKSATVGIFLDPPYSAEAGRDMGCYATDSGTVAHDVREWCAEAGKDARLRIALCGYDGEHNSLELLGWSVFAWKTAGTCGTTSRKDNRANENAGRERIWFSPACEAGEADEHLFAAAAR